MAPRLSGQVALVTGGATGIGRTMADAIGRAGAKTWIASREAVAIATAEREFSALGIAAQGARLDVTQRSEVENLVRDILQQEARSTY